MRYETSTTQTRAAPKTTEHDHAGKALTELTELAFLAMFLLALIWFSGNVL